MRRVMRTAALVAITFSTAAIGSGNGSRGYGGMPWPNGTTPAATRTFCSPASMVAKMLGQTPNFVFVDPCMATS